MNEHNDIFADPWLKKATKTTDLPDDTILACAYNLNIGSNLIEEAASLPFLRRMKSISLV